MKILTSAGKDLTPIKRNKVNSEMKSAQKWKAPGSPCSTTISEDSKSGDLPEEAAASLAQCWTYSEGEFM